MPTLLRRGLANVSDRLQRWWQRRGRRKALFADMHGRLTTLEHVALPLLQELRRGQLVAGAAVLCQQFGLSRHMLCVDAPYPVFNPALVDLDDGFLCVVRCSNLLNFRDGHYVAAATPQDTVNYLLTLGPDLAVKSQRILDDSLLRYPGSPAECGLEDVRLVMHAGRVWGVGSGLAAGATTAAEMVVRQIVFVMEDGRITEFHVAGSPLAQMREKNWTPLYADDGILRLGYSLKPTHFVEFRDNAFIYPEGLHPSLRMVHDLRGGTPFIRWGRGYLSLAHGEPMWWDGRLHYLHYAVVLDEELRLVEVSAGFFIAKRGIEFAAGLCRRGDDLLISLGIADRYAAIVVMPVSVMSSLVMEPGELNSAADGGPAVP